MIGPTNFSGSGNQTETMNVDLLKVKDDIPSSLTFFKYIYGVKMFWIILGIPGNIMCIWVMRQKTFKSMARGYICITLSLADIGLLCMEAIHVNFGYFTKVDMQTIETSAAVCKYMTFILNFLIHMDAWMIVLLNVERLIAVFWPHKIKVFVTKRRVNAAIGLVVLFFCLWDGEEIVRKQVVETLDPVTNQTSSKCENFYWKHISTEVLGTLLPMAILVPANIAIIIKVVQLSRKRRQMSGRSQQNDHYVRLPWMMLCVTTAFIVLLLPSSIYYLLIDSFFSDTFLAVTTLNTANAAINFYLYFLSGSLFRAEVGRLILGGCGCKLGGNSQNVSEVQSSSKLAVVGTSEVGRTEDTDVVLKGQGNVLPEFGGVGNFATVL